MVSTLIVDDNSVFRESLRHVLRTHFPALEVTEAEDGAQTLQHVQAALPDLIFMDIRLRGENGLQLTKKIKSRYPHAVIAITTSYDLPEYRRAARRVGASHFLCKDKLSHERIAAVMESVLTAK